jgi:hypothetical protein
VCVGGFCNEWVCVFVGVLVIREHEFTLFVLFVLCFCIVSFMYIYSYLFCLYWCKDCCHRVTNDLQLLSKVK